MTQFTDIGVSTEGHVGIVEIRRPPHNFFDMSLIKQIAGNLAPDSGSVRFAGRDVTALDTVARARLGRDFRAGEHPRDFFLPAGRIEQHHAGLGHRPA